MALSIRKTVHLNATEAQELKNWAQGFIDRAHDMQTGSRNLRRAMTRRYGSPEYMLTGSNDTYTLNLGFWVE